MKNQEKFKDFWFPDSRALSAGWRYATLSDDGKVFFVWSMDGGWLIKTSGDVMCSAVQACEAAISDFPQLKQIILKVSDDR